MSFTNPLQLLMINAPAERPRQLISAWGVSLCLHALAVATAAALLRDMPQLPPPTFRMELRLHESSDIADRPSVGKDTAGTPRIAPTTARPQREPASSNTQTVKPSDRQPSVIQQSPTQVTPVTRVTQNTLSSLAAVHTTAPITTSQPVEQRVQNSSAAKESSALASHQMSQVVERSQEHAFVPATTRAVSTRATPQEVAIERQERASAPVQQPSAEPTDSAPAHPGQALPSPHGATVDAAETSLPSTGTARHGGETETSTPSAHAGEASGPSAPDPQRAVSTIGHPAINRTIHTGPDFGWLKDLLKRKIKSLQAYPRLAAMQGWEGKVVVHASIGDDGRLLSAVVAESSGFAALDQDALNLMHRATPIHFQQELGQSHIEVFIPVIYHLDR